MAQQETEAGAKGVVQLLAAKANKNFADKIAAALARAGYRIADGAFDPNRIDAVLVLWTGVALDDADLIAKARDAWRARRLAPVSIGRVEPPFGAREMTPMDLAGWRGDDEDPRWGFVLTDIEELKLRARIRPPAEESAVSAPLQKTAPPSPKSQPAPAKTPDASPRVEAEKAEQSKPEHPKAEPKTPPQPRQARISPVLKAPRRSVQQTEQLSATLHPARHAWRYHILPAAPAAAGVLALLVLVAGGAYFAAGLRPAVEPAPERTAAPSASEEEPSEEKPEPGASLSLVRLAPGAKAPETAADRTSQQALKDGPFPPVYEAPQEEGPSVTVTAQIREGAITPPAEVMDGLAAEAETQEPEAMQYAALAAPRLKPVPLEGGRPEELAPEAPDAGEVPAEEFNQAALAELASAVEAARAKDRQAYRGDFFSDCAGCPDMAALEGGPFTMGAPREEAGRQSTDGPQRRVDIGYRFAIATRETTFDQWALCVEEGGCRAYVPADEGWGRADRPVINVSYEDAAAYARWLSAKTGRHYRLPSEAEWEYAARAGTGGAYSSGEAISAEEANFDASETAPVTAFRHNAFGLFGMHGNVQEWTLDCWAPSHNGGPSTGAARIDGDCSRRVVKGGAWNASGSSVRSAARRPADTERRASDTGFRVVRVLD